MKLSKVNFNSNAKSLDPWFSKRPILCVSINVKFSLVLQASNSLCFFKRQILLGPPKLKIFLVLPNVKFSLFLQT